MKNFLLISKIDKANHFIIGYLIYTLSCFIFDYFCALIPLIVIAFCKEIFDIVRRNTGFDLPDFLYTVMGAIPMFILNILK